MYSTWYSALFHNIQCSKALFFKKTLSYNGVIVLGTHQ